MVAHSYATLKLFAFEPIGSVVAAPTLAVSRGHGVPAHYNVHPRRRHWDTRAGARPSASDTEVPNTFGPAAFYEHVGAYGEYRECGESEPQFSEDILRCAKRQGITSRVFRYLALISAGIK